MITAVSASPQLYAVYFRTTPRTSIATERNLQASSLSEATSKAKEAVAKSFPGGVVLSVMLAKDSPWPVMNGNGDWVTPPRD